MKTAAGRHRPPETRTAHMAAVIAAIVAAAVEHDETHGRHAQHEHPEPAKGSGQ